MPDKPHGMPLEGWDRYEILTLLGEGSMASVYKAYDPRLKRFVAIKFVRSKEPDIAARFLREATAQAKIDHENICKIFEAGERNGTPFIVMQHIDGRTLKDAGQELTLEHKCKIIEDTARAIHESHRLGLIHRDLKPANLMIERKQGGYHTYVLDFGLARQTDGPPLTMTGEVIGTPAYMAPEQASGGSRHADPRTDVFSLGTTLYELVTGRVPFLGSNAVETLVEIVESEPVSPRDLNPSIPVELQRIILKCLAKDPDLRYQSANDLASDLKDFRLRMEVASAETIKSGGLPLRRIFVWGVAGLLLLAGLFKAFESIRSYRRALQTQKLEREVEGIESRMRIVFMMPARDATKDIAEARIRVRQLDRQNPEERFLTGRARLATHDYDQAWMDLLSVPRASWHPRYVEAIRAFREKRYPDAIENSRLEAAETPWFYESLVLEGDAYMRVAAGLIEKGQIEEGLKANARAGDAYGSAMLIARSDPQLYVAECRRQNQAAMAVILLKREEAEQLFEKAVAACEQATSVDSRNSDAFREAADVYLNWGEYQRDHGRNPIISLQRSSRMAGEALRLNSHDPRANSILQRSSTLLIPYE